MMRNVISRFDRWLLAPVSAQRLGAVRILVCGFVVVYLAVTVGNFDRVANRDPAEFKPIGLIQLLDRPAPSWMIWAVFAAAILSGVGATLGLRFRISGPVFALVTLFWASYHSSWGQLLHFEHLFTIHLLILALSPAAEPNSSAPSSRFGWPIRLMALATVITYLIAGIAKLRIGGLSWLDGSTLQNHIAYSATRLNLLGGFEPPLAEFIVKQGWILAPMAIAAVVIELAAPIALFGPRARRIWVVSAIAFHAGTAATMLVWFPYQGLGFAFIPLFATDRFEKPKGQHTASPPDHSAEPVGVD